MTDRLALATRIRKARRASIGTICCVPIIIGQPIARADQPARLVPPAVRTARRPHGAAMVTVAPGVTGFAW
jgi:hypothetical protein